MDSRSRFHRSRTPMGTVPISVICGFNYPLSPGETRPKTSYTQTSPMLSIKKKAWPSSLGSRQESRYSSVLNPPELVSLTYSSNPAWIHYI